MSEEQAVEDVQLESEEAPQVDLSAVPEKHRDYVDVDKYVSDEVYKRAIDHGYMPEKLFKESGKDPEYFTGYKSWINTYDDRQAAKLTKQLSEQVEKLSKGQEELLRTQQQREKDAVARALAAKEEALQIAMADGDAVKAVALSNEINQTKMQPAQQPTQQMHPVITRFVENNPILNPASPEFNKEYTDRVWTDAMMMGQDLQKTLRRNDLSHLEIRGILEEAISMNKAPVKQQLQKPPAVAKPGATPKTTDLKNKLTPDAQATYNRLLTMKGGGKEAAEKYAKEVLGGDK